MLKRLNPWLTDWWSDWLKAKKNLAHIFLRTQRKFYNRNFEWNTPNKKTLCREWECEWRTNAFIEELCPRKNEWSSGDVCYNRICVWSGPEDEEEMVGARETEILSSIKWRLVYYSTWILELSYKSILADQQEARH